MKKNNDFNAKLTYAEILNFALTYLGKKCQEGVAQIKQSEGNKEMQDMIRKMYQPWFFKARKMCEMYELETGMEYDGLEAGFGISIDDLR